MYLWRISWEVLVCLLFSILYFVKEKLVLFILLLLIPFVSLLSIFLSLFIFLIIGCTLQALQCSHFCKYACFEEVPELHDMGGPVEGQKLIQVFNFSFSLSLCLFCFKSLLYWQFYTCLSSFGELVVVDVNCHANYWVACTWFYHKLYSLWAWWDQHFQFGIRRKGKIQCTIVW